MEVNSTGKSEKGCRKKRNKGWAENRRVEKILCDSSLVTGRRQSTDRRNGGSRVLMRRGFFQNCCISYESLTSHRIVDNTGRHIRDGDTILGDNFHHLILTTGKKKDISINSDIFFFLTAAVTESGQ